MSQDISADVVVVGAGAIGASCAYHLAAAGQPGRARRGAGRPGRGQHRPLVRLDPRPVGRRAQHRAVLAQHPRPTATSRPRTASTSATGPSGYLLLVARRLWAAQLAAVELQRAHGVPVDVLLVRRRAADHPVRPGRRSAARPGGRPTASSTRTWSRSAWLELARDRGATGAVPQPGDGDRATAGRRLDGRAAGERAVHCAVRGQRRRRLGRRGGRARRAGRAGRALAPQHLLLAPPGALDRAAADDHRLRHRRLPAQRGPRLLFGGARPDQADGYDTERRLAVDGVGARRSRVPRFPWLADLPLDRARLLGRDLREHPRPPRHPRRRPGGADLGQRVRVLRPRPDAGAGDRPARRRADRHRRDHERRRDARCAWSGSPRSATPSGSSWCSDDARPEREAADVPEPAGRPGPRSAWIESTAAELAAFGEQHRAELDDREPGQQVPPRAVPRAGPARLPRPARARPSDGGLGGGVAEYA